MTAEQQYGDSAPKINEPFLKAASCLDCIKADLGSRGFWPARAHLTKRGSLPTFRAVYTYVWQSEISPDLGLVAYVGATKNLRQRIQGHRSKGTLSASIQSIWCKSASENEYLDLESALIADFKPPMNIQGRPPCIWDHRNREGSR